MKWIPAVAFVIGFIPQCEDKPAPEPSEPDPAVAEMADAEFVEESDAAPEEPPPPVEEANAPLLYQITKDGSHRTSWVLGAVTANYPVDFETLPPQIKMALETSTHAMFEVDAGSKAQRDRTKLMATKKDSVRKEVGRKQFAELVKITKRKSGVLDVMKPWVVYVTLEEQLVGDQPMDEALASFATSYRKRIDYLETVHEQVSTLDKAITFDDLDLLIEQHDVHIEAATKASKAYTAGDAKQLTAAIFLPENKRTEIYGRLIGERVPRWSKKLSAKFEEDATFAVVDARYLLASPGLLEALREMGWTVTRVEP